MEKLNHELASLFLVDYVRPSRLVVLAPEPPPGPYGTIMVSGRSGKPPGLSMLAGNVSSAARAGNARVAQSSAPANSFPMSRLVAIDSSLVP